MRSAATAKSPHALKQGKDDDCRKRHIRFQFLGEALALSFMGGILGYLLAILLAQWIGSIPFLSERFEDKNRQGNIHLLVDAKVFVIPFITFSIIGLLSGTWPAIKASRLDPVGALPDE